MKGIAVHGPQWFCPLPSNNYEIERARLICVGVRSPVGELSLYHYCRDRLPEQGFLSQIGYRENIARMCEALEPLGKVENLHEGELYTCELVLRLEVCVQSFDGLDALVQGLCREAGMIVVLFQVVDTRGLTVTSSSYPYPVFNAPGNLVSIRMGISAIGGVSISSLNKSSRHAYRNDGTNYPIIRASAVYMPSLLALKRLGVCTVNLADPNVPDLYLIPDGWDGSPDTAELWVGQAKSFGLQIEGWELFYGTTK